MYKEGKDKRTLGAFYTKSDFITDYIVNRLDLKDNLTILEPAAGDGEFIKAVIKRGHTLEISAFDIDPVAVAQLKQKYPGINVEEKNTLTEIPNKGLGVFTQKKWDRILGNPPYGAVYSPDEKKKYKGLYPEINTTESYAMFLVNCINRLNEGGIISFIISDTFLHLNWHNKLRKFILDNCKIKEIVLLKTKLFPEVNYQYAGLCIFTAEKCKDENVRANNKLRFVNRIGDMDMLIKLRDSPLDDTPNFVHCEQIKQREYLEFVDNVFFQAGIPNKILELFMDHVRLVGELVQCKTGIYSGDNTRHFKIISTSDLFEKYTNAGYQVVKKEETVNRQLTEEEKEKGISEPPYFVPLMKGGSGRYYKKPVWFADWSINSINYMQKNPKARVQNSEYYFKKGICMSLINSNRQQARIMEGYVFDQSDNGFFPEEQYLLFFLGFFNSRLFNYMLKKVINPTANATVDYVKKIPTIMPNESQLIQINTLVWEIIEKKKIDENKSIDDEEKKVDLFFYDLYKLNEEERKLVEDFCYHLR